MAASVKINIKGIDKEFGKAESELVRLINQAQRAAVFSALNELRYTTPVDTGRARNSWTANKSGSFVDSLDGSRGVTFLGPIPPSTIEKLYITNGTPYIRDLNAGSSQQAAPRFIEKALNKFFNFTAGTVKFT